jgi:type I restriction enzyme R subunit
MRKDNANSRSDRVCRLLINGLPVVQIEWKTLGINPRRAIEQIVQYKYDLGNGYSQLPRMGGFDDVGR